MIPALPHFGLPPFILCSKKWIGVENWGNVAKALKKRWEKLIENWTVHCSSFYTVAGLNDFFYYENIVGCILQSVTSCNARQYWQNRLYSNYFCNKSQRCPSKKEKDKKSFKKGKLIILAIAVKDALKNSEREDSEKAKLPIQCPSHLVWIHPWLKWFSTKKPRMLEFINGNSKNKNFNSHLEHPFHNLIRIHISSTLNGRTFQIKCHVCVQHLEIIISTFIQLVL